MVCSTRANLKKHCISFHKGKHDERGNVITDAEIDRRTGTKPRAKPAAKTAPKAPPKAIAKRPAPVPPGADPQWPRHPLDTDATRVDAAPPAGPAPVLYVPQLSDEEDEDRPVDHEALLAVFRQQTADGQAPVAAPDPPPAAPELLNCPDPNCIRRGANGIKSKGGLTRHVNVNHPELADDPAPEYNEDNFAAKRGIGPVETPHHILAECTAAAIVDLRIKYYLDGSDNSLCFPKTARFFREVFELLQPKTSADSPTT